MAEIPTPTGGGPATKSRPLGVTILSILMIIGGVLNLVSALGSYTTFDMAWSGISGVIGLILGISMWQLIPWARKAAMIWYIISLIMVFVMVVVTAMLLGPLFFMIVLIAFLPALVIDLIIIFYLNSGGVKAAFEGVGGW